MEETIWKCAQVLMWVIGLQTVVIIAAFSGLWVHINKRFDKLEFRVQHVENDMIEVKTILRMKECCMIQDDRHMKKVE